MNKYRIYTGLFVILSLVVCTIDTGSRKRYRKKKQASKSINTLMDINSTNENTLFNQSTPITALPAAAQNTLDFTEPISQDIIDVASYAPLSEEKKIAAPIFEEEDQDIEDSIEFNFENAGLENLVQQIQDIFEITFISDDAIQPLPQGKKSIKGNKISFKTNVPLSKKDAWNLFLSFLDLAGFAVVPHTDPKVFRITTIESARKSPLPAYIGVDYTTLPDSDEIIRYVYFLENASIETIKSIIDPLRSSSSQGLIELKEHKGFLLTDKAYNIKMLMKIIKELDKVSIPESMAILKLRNADAKEVQKLYASLLPKEEQTSRFFTKKQPTSLYFPENTRIIAEPRTNTLILLGPVDAIRKIETFIIKYIDVELDQAYSPLFTYQLKYADATTIADIMTNVTAFGKDSEAGIYGGVRGVDQYMRPMSFIPEKETNKLIIKGYYEDYLKCKKVIDQLDEAQPQVAIEVLVASIHIDNEKNLGAQLRSKAPGPNGLLGNNIKFQTSGLYTTGQIVTQNVPPVSGADRLLGNLLNLVTGAVPGTTLVQLGADALGIWGIFQALQTVTDTEILSNPFLLATNNTKATVALGLERRVVTSQVIGTTPQNAFGAADANLEVVITPQINSDGMIVLKVSVTLDDFTDPTNPISATKTTKNVTTNAIVANEEVLALGGLIRTNTATTETKVPILGDIPILGWFFKNRKKSEAKDNLLILISTRIIPPHSDKESREFTKYHVADYQETLAMMENAADMHDPIYHTFFEDKQARKKKSAENLIFKRKEEAKEIKQEKEAEKSEESAPQNNVPADEPLQQQVAQNKLLSTIRQKKRTELSLSQFMQDKEDIT